MSKNKNGLANYFKKATIKIGNNGALFFNRFKAGRHFYFILGIRIKDIVMKIDFKNNWE